MAAPSRFDNLYVRLCSRCICEDFNDLKNDFQDVIDCIQLSAALGTEEPDVHLLAVSVLRFLGELVMMPAACGKLVQYFEKASSKLCSDLVNSLVTDSGFTSHLCRKVLCLICKQNADRASSIVRQICRHISDEMEIKITTLASILNVKSMNTDSLNLAGEEDEWLLNCKDVVRTRNNTDNIDSYKLQWIDEIMQCSHRWLTSSSKCTAQVLELCSQIISIALESQKDEYITTFFVNEENVLLNSVLHCATCRSLRIWTSIYKDVLSNDHLKSHFLRHISVQFLTNLEQGLVEKVCLCESKVHSDFHTSISSNVFNRNLILCSLCALLNVHDAKWTASLTTLHDLVKGRTVASKAETYESLVISLFIDQDDQVVDVIVYHFDIYIHRETDLSEHFCPFKLLIEFFKVIDYDDHVILDMLTSNETRMLLLLVRSLKLVISEWDLFVEAHLPNFSKNESKLKRYSVNENLELTMGMLIRLYLKVERLQEKGIFPYNARPLLRLLNKCEECYETISM